MHSEIFTRNQQELLPFLGAFRRSFYLVGGTAIALHLGHRRSVEYKPVISMPTLLSLAAMKAFALGRRSKWKDYVDLWFILKHHFSVKEISEEANQLFPGQFSEKLFRGQLSFHKDIDFSEPVEFMGMPVPEEEIKAFLIEQAIGFLDD